MAADHAELLGLLQSLAAKNSDLVLRTLSVPPNAIPCTVAFLEGCTNKELVQAHVLYPLLQPEPYCVEEPLTDVAQRLACRFICVSEVRPAPTAAAAEAELFQGSVLLIAAGMEGALCLRLEGFPRRLPSPPLNDRTVSGPRDGFTESLPGNLGQVRRRLQDPRLRVERRTLGRRTKTAVALLYVEDIALPETVNALRDRLEDIDADGILAGGVLAQLCESEPASPFPTYREIERPDIAVAALLEGRVVLFCDGSPLALCFPTLFVELLQAAEDYYEKPMPGNVARALRWLCFFLSVSLPALYVALVSFRPEILPYDLLVSIAGQRSEVPFPAVWEVLFISFAVMCIIECSLRLPEPLGQTIGVVSGILVGQAIISASLASPMVLIVVALANICSFCIPSFSLAISVRMLQLFMIFPSAMLGLFGFSLSWMFLLVHMHGLSSMGRPYLAPLAPHIAPDRKDALLRAPLTSHVLRPLSVGNQNARRQRRKP